MKKILSIFAASLVALAVNAQTDFAAPGYYCAADDAVLSGTAGSSKIFLDETTTPHQVTFSDISKDYTAVATWTVTATRGCYVSVAMEMGTFIGSSNKHIFDVKIFDSKNVERGHLSQGSDHTGASTAESTVTEAFDGTILLPTAGEYRVEIHHNRDWCKGSIRNVILTYAADAPSEIIDVTSVELNKSELALQVDEVEQLSATVLPDNATDPSVTWSSDDEAVATVSEDGFVTAVAIGTANIKAKAGDVEAICAVTVSAVSVPDVDFASACVLSAKKAQLEGKIWKMYTSDTYKLYGDGGHNKIYGNALWTINVTHPCIVSAVLNGVEGGHLFELDLYKGEELVATIAQPEGKTWSAGEIALEGTLTFAEAGEYTLKLRNTQEWSSGKVAGITLSFVSELPQTLYLEPNSDWLSDGAKFAVFYFKSADDSDNGWTDFLELAEDETAIYTASVPADYNTVIFVRFSSEAAAPAWNDDIKWNQTQDLTIEEGYNLCRIVDWGWGEWSKYGLKFRISGSMSSWSPTIESFENSYKLHLEAGSHQFKVVNLESAWLGYSNLTEEYRAPEIYPDQDGNVCFVLDAEGDVVVTYIKDEVFKVEGSFVPAPVKIIGINGWTEATDAIAFTPEEDHLTTSATIYLEGWYYEFKMIVGGAWLGKENGGEMYHLHREWTKVSGLTNAGDNIKLTMDDKDLVPGNYKFTWTYATGELNVTFPDKETTALDNTNADAKVIKTIENGQLVIIKNGIRYNAQGAVVK